MNGYLVVAESGEIVDLMPGYRMIFWRDHDGMGVYNIQRLELAPVMPGRATDLQLSAFIICSNGCIKFSVSKMGKDIKLNNAPLNEGEEVCLMQSDELSIDGKHYIFKTEGESIQLQAFHASGLEELQINGREKICAVYQMNKISDFQLGMVRSNNTGILLKMDYLSMDEELKIIYDCDGLVSLKQLLVADRLGDLNIFRILFNISLAILRSEDYLIQVENLLLTIDRIFVDPVDLSVKLFFSPTGGGGTIIRNEILRIVESIEAYSKKGACYSGITMLKRNLKEKTVGLDAFTQLLLEEERNHVSLEKIELRGRVIATEALPGVKEIEEGRTTSIAALKKVMYKDKKTTLFIIQAVLVSLSVWIYMLEILEPMDYCGYLILLTALDFWLVKSFTLI